MESVPNIFLSNPELCAVALRNKTFLLGADISMKC